MSESAQLWTLDNLIEWTKLLFPATTPLLRPQSLSGKMNPYTSVA